MDKEDVYTYTYTHTDTHTHRHRYYEAKGSELSNTKAPVMLSISGNSTEFSAPDPVKRHVIDAKSRLFGKDPDAGKDCTQKDKGMAGSVTSNSL